MFAALGGAAAQDTPATSGGFERRSYDVAPFDEVVGVGPHDFVVSVGGALSVRAEGTAEALEFYEVVVEDEALAIRPKEKYRRDWDWEAFEVEPAIYYITLPRLEAAALAGSGAMLVDRVGGADFSASLAGSGKLEIGAIAVDDVRLVVAGSGKLSAAGTTRRARVSIAGSGDLVAPGMASTTAQVSIAGSGDASLTVDEEAQISIVGSGDVEIAGNASCTVSGFGSGNARCKDGVHGTRKSWGAWENRRGARDWSEWAHAWDGWSEWRHAWGGWGRREDD
jgi:hypothetical protein